MGNIQFKKQSVSDNDYRGVTVINKDIINIISNILQINNNELIEGITHRSFKINGKLTRIPLDINGAINARDALSKHLYSKMFDLVLKNINKTLNNNNNNNNNNNSNNDNNNNKINSCGVWIFLDLNYFKKTILNNCVLIMQMKNYNCSLVILCLKWKKN